MSAWTDIRDKIVGVAPTLASALGTAAGGPVLGAAVGALSQALLGRKDGTPDELAAHIATMPPDKLLELRALDNTFKLEMERLGYKLEELEVDDRKDARAMQTAALSQDDLMAKRFIYYYTWFLTAVSMTYIFCITFIPIPQENQQMANIVLGAILGTILTTMVGYFYGTSYSERGKAKRSEDRAQSEGR